MNLPNNKTFEFKTLTTSAVSFMSQVYLWMTAGLLSSGLTAYLVASNPIALNTILTNKFLFWTIIILQFGAVIWLSARAQAMSRMLAGSLFIAYSILTGLTFSLVLMAFTMTSIATAFFICSFAFFGLSIFGYVTKINLQFIGSFCMMGLFGLIGLFLLSWIFPSIMTQGMAMTINVIGVLIFAGLTAFDTQKIKMLGSTGYGHNSAIHGALILYLDFINLFLFILNIVGQRK